MHGLANHTGRASAAFSFLFLVAIAAMIAQPRQIVSLTSRLAPAPALLTAPSPQAPAAPETAAPAAPALDLALAAPPVVIDASYAPTVDRSGPPVQCAIYARQRTGVSLAGAAREWWPQAEGLYPRTHTPQVGAVMVMGGTTSGHVAVVSKVLSSRQILVDHANWMNQGEITLNALVEDASANNDWSSVRVWHVPSKQLGLRPYPVFGFVIPDQKGKTAEAKAAAKPGRA